ncbi:MAG: hypothetical protein NT012_02810 [Candidatus Nealsonbacteria bacterium]|nr:hypothetical protein [Candidatus Nealsonbacteria bacterium]
MKIQKIFAAIRKIFDTVTYITVYRIVSFLGIILMLGIIINSIYFKHDATKLFVIFLSALDLFVIVSLLFVVNSFTRAAVKGEEEDLSSLTKQQDEKITVSQKEGLTK